MNLIILNNFLKFSETILIFLMRCLYNYICTRDFIYTYKYFYFYIHIHINIFMTYWWTGKIHMFPMMSLERQTFITKFEKKLGNLHMQFLERP